VYLYGFGICDVVLQGSAVGPGYLYCWALWATALYLGIGEVLEQSLSSSLWGMCDETGNESVSV
jgi:hypothetical protein